MTTKQAPKIPIENPQIPPYRGMNGNPCSDYATAYLTLSMISFKQGRISRERLLEILDISPNFRPVAQA